MEKHDYPECCDINKVEQLKKNMLDNSILQLMTDLFSSLGDENRLKMVIALSKSELCVHELALTVDSTTSAVSHQLRKLRDRGIVTSRRDGQVKYYTLSDERIRQMLDIVIDFESVQKESEMVEKV
ncbi:ArsR family transcriptional regulator [bacterium]|nr:MAG: ArsR family transcriptional regulator [bacterium]